MSAKQQWFSYSPCSGFDFHDTAAEARDHAQKDLDYFRDEAGDGWDEEVESVCWGEIKQSVGVLWEKSRPPKEQLDECGRDKDGRDWREFDVIKDYALFPKLDEATPEVPA